MVAQTRFGDAFPRRQESLTSGGLAMDTEPSNRKAKRRERRCRRCRSASWAAASAATASSRCCSFACASNRATRSSSSSSLYVGNHPLKITSFGRNINIVCRSCQPSLCTKHRHFGFPSGIRVSLVRNREVCLHNLQAISASVLSSNRSINQTVWQQLLQR